MKILSEDFKFIDLFAGIGGFHFAMKKYSPRAECIFASEINANAIKLYKHNFSISSDFDIKSTSGNDMEYFDVLCAGFPCQPFSKAGHRNGFNDTRGTLFFEIVRIIEEKIAVNQKPKILILENVRNLESHDDGNTWKTIHNALVQLGYNTIHKPLILKPLDFGIPQLRDRAIILAIDNNIFNDHIDFIPMKNKTVKNISKIYETNSKEIMDNFSIKKYEEQVLEAWDFFIKNLDRKILGFPVWSDEFGQNYDIGHLPLWKQNFINKNRSLYASNKIMIDKWRKIYGVNDFKKTHRKFEWQAGISIDSVFEGIIQFRPSGVRVKKPNYSPTLVAMAHVPIIGKYKRYMTPKEAARLQSLPENFDFDSIGNDIYRLLGNAVNVDVIYNVFTQFIEYIETQKKIKDRGGK